MPPDPQISQVKSDQDRCPCCNARQWWLNPNNEIVKRQGWDAFAAALVNAAAREHAEGRVAELSGASDETDAPKET